MNQLLVFIFTFLLSLAGMSQELQWTQFQNLNDSLRAEPKFIIVFIHTDWCKVCSMQENNTFQSHELIKSLGNKAYWLKLNAEQKDDIYFAGKRYSFTPSGTNGYHELAAFLAKDSEQPLSYPTTVILTADFWLIKRFIGLTEANELMNIFKKQE